MAMLIYRKGRSIIRKLVIDMLTLIAIQKTILQMKNLRQKYINILIQSISTIISISVTDRELILLKQWVTQMKKYI